MLEWYSNLSIDLMVFYAIALAASLILVLQLVMSIMGGDGHFDFDAGDMDVGNGLGFFSLRSLTGFFGGFGWAGVIALENGLSLGAAVLLGVLAGGFLMLSVALAMKLLYSLRQSGTAEFEDALGRTATVYVAVPPSQSGAGKVRVTIQGRLKVVPAYTDCDVRIPSQKKVKVVGLVDEHTLLVEPAAPEKAAQPAPKEEHN